MDGSQKNKRQISVIMAVNVAALAGYMAFGMAPAPGGLKQILLGATLAIVGWSACAYTWWQASSTDPTDPPPDAP